MSFPGLSRPTRGAGLALLAVAVVAAVTGGVVLATGDGDGDGTQQAAGGSSSDSPETSGSSGSPATSSGGRSSGSSSSTAEGGASSEPGDGSASSGSSTRSDESADEGDGDSEQSDGHGDGGHSDGGHSDGGHSDGGHSDRVPVRVYNNSLIKDLASEAAEDLRNDGWRVEKVSNYSGGVIPETTAYYRKGTAEKAAAMSVAGEFGIRAKPRFHGIKDAHDGLIVIVAKDYKS